MPQNGFHGLVGLALARPLARRVAEPVPFVAGLVLGSMLPDVDGYPAAAAVLLKHPELQYSIHRSATHSVFFALLLLLVAMLKGRSRFLFLGLGFGVLTHIVLDVAFWFAPIDLFWPFGEGGLHSGLPSIDLWGPNTPLLLINLRQAFELAAFALYLGALRRIAERRQLLKWERLAWAWFSVAAVTAFFFRTKELHENLVVMTPYLLLLLPLSWWETWKLREKIVAWCLRTQQMPAPAAD